MNRKIHLCQNPNPPRSSITLSYVYCLNTTLLSCEAFIVLPMVKLHNYLIKFDFAFTLGYNITFVLIFLANYNFIGTFTEYTRNSIPVAKKMARPGPRKIKMTAASQLIKTCIALAIKNKRLKTSNERQTRPTTLTLNQMYDIHFMDITKLLYIIKLICDKVVYILTR